jgi:hypothetical protein
VKKYTFLLAFLILTINLFAQDSTSLEGISETNKIAIERLTGQIKDFPQEKIYLQLDRPIYSAGDRIWYRVHMEHATLHTPIAYSRFVYVELLNAHDEVVVRKKIRQTEEAIFFGQIDLSPEIAQGWYSVRAYTNFMRNIDESYFFRQRIFIGNSLKGMNGVNVDEKTGSYSGISKEAVKPQPEFDVQFFPEGGNMIAGNTQMIGFKAVSRNGLGTDISGRILDDKKTEIYTFKSSHLGMGAFIMTPEPGKKYSVVCEDSRGQSLTFTLPEASVSHYALAVKQNASILNVSILTPNGAARTDTLYLIGALRGLPFMQSTLLPDNQSLSISKTGFGSGVTQLMLLNKKGEILSERLVYISGKDKANLSVTLDKGNYIKRDAVHASLLLKDSKGKPVEGNFSISVTDDNDVKTNPDETTIESYLLLQSDLKGNIENPNAYFRADNKSAAFQLDMLMLTQGWKRYNTQAVLAGKPDKPGRYELEVGPVITGKVQNFPARRGIPKINVSFIAHNNMHFDAVTTDNYGRFKYSSPDFPDSTTFLVQADKKPGSFVELVVNADSFPKVEHSCLFPVELKQDLSMKDFMKKSRDRYYYQNGMMSRTLNTVVVTTKKIDKNKKIREDRGSMYSNPSYTFDEDDLETANNIMFLLAQAPGIMVGGDNRSITMRGKTPAIMVDNFEYPMDELQSINLSDVKLIDILREPSETMSYGTRGQNGVIAIYLKRGEDRKGDPMELGRNQAKITPLGYTLPAEFYVPKYQVEETRQNPIPDLRSTIFWKPNVKTDAKGQTDLFFNTADTPGTYTITAEGVTPEGEIIRYQGKLNRK